MANDFGVYKSVKETIPFASWDLDKAFEHLTAKRENPIFEQQNYKNGTSLAACFGAHCPTARKQKSADNEISGLVSLDFDNIPKEQVLAFLEQVKALPYVLLTWPSGSYYKVDDLNKGGIKIVVEPELPPISPESYKKIWEAVASRVAQDIPDLQPYFDTKCHDLTRLCFLSYAPDAWLNPDPATLEVTGSRNDLLFNRVSDYGKKGISANGIRDRLTEDNRRLRNPLPEEELEDGILRPDTLIRATSNRRKGSAQNIANAQDLLKYFLPGQFQDMRWDDYIDNIPGFDWDSEVSAIRLAMHRAEHEVTKETVMEAIKGYAKADGPCLLYTSPSPRDRQKSRMPSSA